MGRTDELQLRDQIEPVEPTLSEQQGAEALAEVQRRAEREIWEALPVSIRALGLDTSQPRCYT